MDEPSNDARPDPASGWTLGAGGLRRSHGWCWQLIAIVPGAVLLGMGYLGYGILIVIVGLAAGREPVLTMLPPDPELIADALLSAHPDAEPFEIPGPALNAWLARRGSPRTTRRLSRRRWPRGRCVAASAASAVAMGAGDARPRHSSSRVIRAASSPKRSASAGDDAPSTRSRRDRHLRRRSRSPAPRVRRRRSSARTTPGRGRG